MQKDGTSYPVRGSPDGYRGHRALATVREDIREHALRIDIDATEIPRRVEAAGKLTIHEDIFIPLGG